MCWRLEEEDGDLAGGSFQSHYQTSFAGLVLSDNGVIMQIRHPCTCTSVVQVRGVYVNVTSAGNARPRSFLCTRS